MKARAWSLIGLLAVASIGIGTHVAAMTSNQRDDERSIQELQNRLAISVSTGNLDGVMRDYLPGKELFVFDSDLPRQHTGWESFKSDWANFVNSASDVTYEVRDLNVTVVGDAAFSHHLAHMVWKNKKDGSRREQLMSITDAYRKVGGRWLIAMEHFSIPVVDGKAIFVAWPSQP